MASKNIIAKDTTYNGVESVTFPTSPSGTATFFEVSDTTATASDVLNSKYFYTAAGVKTQGTGTAPSPTLITKSITANGTYNASSDNADGYSSVTVSVSGSGSGLVYESGTWEPSQDEYLHLQYFSNIHSTAPMFFSVSDATGTASDTTYDNFDLTYVNFEQAVGSGGASTSSQTIYGLVGMRYKTSSTNTQGATNVITVPLSQSDGSTSGHPTFWATNEYIKFNTTSNARYWRAGRTYKWIAVWAPTT